MKDIFVDIIPIEPLPELPPEPLFSSDPQFDGQDVYVTVYWLTQFDGYIVAGWPTPMWIVGNYDEMKLTPNESVRIWI